jgi:MATE family multidrug resistance protein
MANLSRDAREVTHRRVLNIAMPIVLSNATVPILGAVDTGVVGQLGEAAPIGAVGIGAVILGAIYWVFGFLRMGTVGLTAQAAGEENTSEVAALLTRSLIIGIGAGVALIVLQIPIFYAAFLVSPSSAEVESLAREYMVIRIWSAPAAIALYGITGWLIALERTRAVMVLQLWMNGLNIGLDFWFVLGLGWGVEGVALGTFIAEWTALALGLWFCRAVFAKPDWRNWPHVFDAARLWHMLAVNTDIMIRSVLLQVMFVSFLFLGGGRGDLALAANQILLQFLFITAYALDGFAAAAEAMVGNAMGARNRKTLRRAAVLTSGWGVVSVLLMSLVFAVFGGAIIDVMTTSPEVRAEARIYLIYMVLAPTLGVASWMLDGIFIGATRTRDMRNMMILSTMIYLAALGVLVPLFGNHGLWSAFLLSFVARGITLGWKYPNLEAAADTPR